MSNNEAKFVLGAYRANGRDAEDATFGAALAQALNANPLNRLSGLYQFAPGLAGGLVVGPGRDLDAPARFHRAGVGVQTGQRAARRAA